MQYAPLINASTKLGYIHRSLSQPITWLPTQSVKIFSYSFQKISRTNPPPLLIHTFQNFITGKLCILKNHQSLIIEKSKILEMRIEIDSKQSNRVSSHRNRESLPPFLSSVTGSRGYATRSDNAATRFRWTSRPNPLEKRDYSRLIGTELWRNFEAALEGRAGADCRGSGFRPVASFLSLSGTRFSPPVPWLGNWTRPSSIYIYIHVLQSGWPRIVTDFTIGRCNFVERFTKIHGSMLPPKVSTLKGLRRSRENPQREENLRDTTGWMEEGYISFEQFLWSIVLAFFY